MNLSQLKTSKQSSNGHLLNLLTKRSSKSVHTLKSDWPGKYGPNLANIQINRKISKNAADFDSTNGKNREQEQLLKTHYTKHIRSVPLIKMNSISLSLQPSARSKTIIMRSTLKQTQKTNFFSDVSSARTKKVKSPQPDEVQFNNNRVSSAFSNQQLSTFKKDHAMEILGKVQSSKQKKAKNVLDKYVIDYSTFNYIEKVIDDPEKWTKFVHKKNPFSSQFVTETKY